MDFLNRLIQQFSTFWGSMKGRQKATLLTAATLLLAGLIGLVVWANYVTYAPLFTNLRPEQVPPIIESLKSRKEQYRISYGGTVVEVPSDRVLDLRLSLAGQGVLKDGMVGFEVFDKGGIGVTNFVERLNYQRALQGELMRTINELDAVEASRVHIVLPKESLFVRDERPATASVVVKLAGGQRLSKDQVNGIVNLVAASVEGLKAEYVSVVDSEGRTLAAPRNDSVAAASSNLLDYQETLERRLEARVVEFLERVVGPGKAIAKVQASLEMKSVETTNEAFNPDTRVPRSEQTRTETRKNVGPDATGVPGTAANLPGNAAANTTGTGNTTMERNESTINYEVDKTVSHSVQAPGQLKRISVAVLIDGSYKAAAAAAAAAAATAAAKGEYVARTPEEMKTFEQIVRNAVGYSEERGDEVTVSNLQFHQLDTDLSTADGGIPWERPVRYGMVILGMILIFMLLRPLLKSIAEDVKVQADDLGAGALGAGAGEAGAAGALGPGGISPKALAAGSQERQRREEMINLARSDIDNTVQTVRDWLRTSNTPAK
ncbi:MAG: flagellar basal-body MS-ring/collar protein FliF [Myxococcota bacterium]